MRSVDATASEAKVKKQFGAKLYTIQKGTGWNFRKAWKIAVEILTQFKKGQVEVKLGTGFFKKTPSPIKLYASYTQFPYTKRTRSQQLPARTLI